MSYFKKEDISKIFDESYDIGEASDELKSIVSQISIKIIMLYRFDYNYGDDFGDLDNLIKERTIHTLNTHILKYKRKRTYSELTSIVKSHWANIMKKGVSKSISEWKAKKRNDKLNKILD